MSTPTATAAAQCNAALEAVHVHLLVGMTLAKANTSPERAFQVS